MGGPRARRFEVPSAVDPSRNHRSACARRATDDDGCPVVAVVGPAGYGKTTLLGQWAATSDVPVIWLTLDAHDNDPAILLSYLVAIMNRIEPADPQLCRSLLAEAAVDTNWSLRRLAMLVSSRRRRFGLVVDHTESVTDPRSGDLLATVALNLPPGCRIAFASRAELPLPMARLRAEGAVEEIGVEQLAMDESEATALLGEVHAGIEASGDSRTGAAHGGMARRPVPRRA